MKAIELRVKKLIQTSGQICRLITRAAEERGYLTQEEKKNIVRVTLQTEEDVQMQLEFLARVIDNKNLVNGSASLRESFNPIDHVEAFTPQLLDEGYTEEDIEDLYHFARNEISY